MKVCLNKDYYLYLTKISNYILKHDTCLVQIKVGCFFKHFGYSVLFWELQASPENTDN